MGSESNPRHDGHGLGLEQFGLVTDAGLALDEQPIAPPQDQPAQRIPPPASQQAGSPLNGAGESLRLDPEPIPIRPTGILEALLFVGDGSLPAEQAAKVIRGIKPEAVDALVAELEDQYQRHGCPYEIVADAGGYRLQLRHDFQRVAERIYQRNRVARVSPAAIEVLALIAYRQPLNRQTIENLRGAECSGLLRQLVRRGLLRITREGPNSRDVLYHTTSRFLEVFQLDEIDALPRSEDLDKL